MTYDIAHLVPDARTALAVALHRGGAAQQVRRLKYARQVGEVSAAVVALSAAPRDVDVVSWVPASGRQRRRRGFDQAELLARAIAHRIGRPAVCTLRRVDREPQSQRSRSGRLRGPDLRVRGRHRVRGRRLLLIDDVATTGSSLSAAIGCLVAAGVASVDARVLTVAVAPGVGDPCTVEVNPTFGGKEWTSPSVHGM